MHCQFFNGPLDGWQHECARALIAEEWRVGYCVADKDTIVLFCVVENWTPANVSSPIARYQLVAQGLMRFVGMLKQSTSKSKSCQRP